MNMNCKSRSPIIIICLLVAISISSLVFKGCGSRDSKPEAKVLLIGLDGIEMDVLRPLLEDGELPNIAGLIDRGVIGPLRTFKPTLSPVIWTSIATGKTPNEHLISHFVSSDRTTPYTSNSRKGKAIWNIVSDYDLKANVSGFWMTWPAEKINGCMVSQITCRAQLAKIWKGMLYKDVEKATWPSELIDEIWPIVQPFQTKEFIDETILPQIFNDLDGIAISDEEQELLLDSKWSFAGDYINFKASEYLMDKYPADIDIVYIGGTDVIAHRFWRYRSPELYSYNIDKKSQAAFRNAIDNYYKLADKMVGDLISKVPDNTRVIICSDHGMKADFFKGKSNNNNPTSMSAHHYNGPPGVIIAAGDGIKRGPGLKAYLGIKDIEELGTVFDITPTILYLLDIPVGRDMRPGGVMKTVVSDAQLKKRPIEKIDTHDVDFRPPTAPISSRDSDRSYVEVFKKLGYIDAGPQNAKFEMGEKGK